MRYFFLTLAVLMCASAAAHLDNLPHAVISFTFAALFTVAYLAERSRTGR